MKNNLKKIRGEKDLRQWQVAESVGISVRHYQALEYGDNVPNVHLAIRVADELGVKDIRDLFPINQENQKAK